MKPIRALVPILVTGLLSSAAAIAQVAIVKPPVTSVNCPVSLEVSQDVPGRLLLLQQGFERDSQTRPGVQRPVNVHFSLTNPTPVDIVAVDVFLHGSSDEPRTEKTPARFVQPSDVGKSFRLQFKVKADSDADANLRVQGFSLSGQVDITFIAFTGGSSWHESSTTSCHTNLRPYL